MSGKVPPRAAPTLLTYHGRKVQGKMGRFRTFGISINTNLCGMETVRGHHRKPNIVPGGWVQEGECIQKLVGKQGAEAGEQASRRTGGTTSITPTTTDQYHCACAYVRVLTHPFFKGGQEEDHKYPLAGGEWSRERGATYRNAPHRRGSKNHQGKDIYFKFCIFIHSIILC